MQTATQAPPLQHLSGITDPLAATMASLSPKSQPPRNGNESTRFWQADPGPQSPTPDGCPVCSGVGWVQSQTGSAVRCKVCADFLASSRLAESERENRLAGIHPASPIHPVAVHMAQGLLADRGGWLTLWGSYGSGKSLVLTALVADACRSGRMGRYYTGMDILKQFQQDMDRTDNAEAGRGMSLDFLANVPVLAIDELTGFHSSSDWFARHFVELMDRRYRNADRQITILALNPDPALWCSGPGSAWGVSGPAILSRMRDGRFCRDWPAGMSHPKGMERERVIPGILRFDAPDMRPRLSRPTDSPQRTSEVNFREEATDVRNNR